MAAAIIPILTAAAPLIIPLIKDLALGVQKIFGHNNGTGAVKAETVISSVMAVLDQMQKAGKIPGIIDATTVAVMVENVVQQLKGDGLLPSDGKPTVPPLTTSPAAPPVGTMNITGTITVSK